MRKDVPASRHPGDAALGVHLRVRQIRLAEGEPAAGSQARERVLEAPVEVDVVQYAYADDGVERPLVETFARLRVSDDDLGGGVDPGSGAFGGRRAELERGEPGRVLQPHGELTSPAAELEALNPWGQAGGGLQEARPPVGAAGARRARPAPPRLQPLGR